MTHYVLFAVVEELPVTIVPTPSIPDSGTYQIGSSLILTCQAQGGHLPLTYSWNSSCDGLCFILGETTTLVRKSALHSTDSGNHTCSVTDYAGQTGAAAMELTLSGSYNYI